MLYNPKTDFPFWLRDCHTELKILEARKKSLEFICETYRPILQIAGELLTYYNFNELEMNDGTRQNILDTIHELHEEVEFYQSVTRDLCEEES